MAGHHVRKVYNSRNSILKSHLLPFPSTIEKRYNTNVFYVSMVLFRYLIIIYFLFFLRLFCTCYVCPLHQKIIRKSLNNSKSIAYDFGTNVSSHKNRLSKSQPSRQIFQVPEMLKSNKRKEYSNRKLIG